MTVRRVATVLLAVLAACATAPMARQIDRTVTVPRADFGAGWDAVIDIFGERTWAIDNMERDSGLITTDWMIAGDMSGSYMDCGSAGLSSDRNHTHRTTRALGSGAGHLVQCVSTGVLEREIHEEVTSRVGNL